MSLDYDFRDIKDYERVTTHPVHSNQYHPITYFIIWTMMAIRMGQITTKNVDKVWERMNLYQLVTGPAIRFTDGTEVWVKREDIEMHIGLRTNVSEEKDAEFFRLLKTYAKDIPANRFGMHGLSGWYTINARLKK